MRRKTVEFPLNDERIETGPVRFGEDWPGVFVRGDDAIMFAVVLKKFLRSQEFDEQSIEEAGQRLELRRLTDLLNSCFVKRDPRLAGHITPETAQHYTAQQPQV
jgi:hypothetical protein